MLLHNANQVTSWICYVTATAKHSLQVSTDVALTSLELLERESVCVCVREGVQGVYETHLQLLARRRLGLSHGL